MTPTSPPRFHGPASAPVLTAAAMRAWDRRSIDEHGVPEAVLMEAAGRAAAAVVQRLFPTGRVAAAVGGGNNGGDALVLLRTLRAWGRDVVAVVVGTSADRSLLHEWQVETAAADEAGAVFRDAAVVVDGLLGTGARGAPREAMASVIRAMNGAGRPVVALDGPSGIDFTTGACPGVAVRADVSVTFGALKTGLLRFPGREHAGRVVVAEIGLVPFAPSTDDALLVTPAWARGRLPRVAADAHKGRTGAVTVLAGSGGMAGAAVLAGSGAVRAGAGMVRLASAAENRIILQGALPEALFVDRGSPSSFDAAVDAADALVCGPGMGTGDDVLALLRRGVARAECPVLFDADAVTLLARHPDLRDAVRGPLLLTPHPGEMGRLLGRTTEDVLAEPLAAASEAAARFRCAVLLKGAPSVVAQERAPTLVSVVGHAGIATGGNGDVLSGVAGALLAVRTPAREAGALALYLAGRAAQLAGRGRGLLPRDVVEALPAVILELGDDDPEPLVPGVVLDLPAAY